MQQKKKVSVRIEGRNYSLISDEDPRYVRSVADEVAEHMAKTAEGSKLDARDCAVLAALDFCDERKKVGKRYRELSSKGDQIIRHTNDLNKMCSEYKEKLTEAINENTELVRRIKRLESQAAQLREENDKLRSALAAGESKETSASDKVVTGKKPEKTSSVHQYSLFEDDGNENAGKK